MRKFKNLHLRISVSLFLLAFSLITTTLRAQSLTMRDFGIIAGLGGPGIVAPPTPGYGVFLGSSNTINGGSVGSYNLVQTTGNANITANIYSRGKVTLANSNMVTGKIAAANTGSLPGTILSVGTSANLGGDIDVNGNIVIGGGTVSGIVTHPFPTTYSGPNIGARNRTAAPSLPTLPQLPDTTIFEPAGSTNKSSGTIAPGAYGNLTIGNTTVTLSGPGTYIFKSISSSGPNSRIIFDFKGTTTGNFLIYVYGNVVLNRMTASVTNGGSASRIYTETHGRASIAWNMSNGSNGTSNTAMWLGTVYAPFGAIAMGTPNGPASFVTGALWSGTQVNIQGTATVNYSPLSADQEIIKPFNTNLGKVSTIIGAELTSITMGISDEARKQMIISGDNVLIDVIANVGHEADVLSYLISEGMTGIISGINPLITTGYFPIANLLHLNTRGDIIKLCMPVFVPPFNSGLIKNAGDTAIGTQLVRNGYNLQGLGIKVGVLSDSYNALVTSTNDPVQLDISTGELPGVGNPVNSTPVVVVDPLPQSSGSDEGRAMLQIVHDIAPKASLYFRTGFRGPNDFALGIKHLQEAGCNVIVDDITYVNELFFQDGPVAKTVDLVKSLGVSYFTSAGNFGINGHLQNYRAVPAPAGFPAGTTAHDFSGTGDIYQHIRLKPGSYTIALQWEDSIFSSGVTHTGTRNDIDFYLTDMSGNIICGFNRDNTLNGGGEPFEFLAYTVSSSVAIADANILITRANAGTPSPRFKYIIFRGDAVIAEYQTGPATIVGHANAAGAVAVGAINYFKTPAFTSATPTIAPYSSIGGMLIDGTDRNKPDITAPDGVNTSVNMGADISGDTDPFSNFFGTSSAAPHAAATAALLIEGRKRFLDEVASPDGVKNLLQSTAINVGPANAAGAGLIQADLAMRTFAEPTPLLITLEYPSTITPTSFPSSSFTLTVNGDYLSEESQVLFRGAAVPTTFVSTTELTAIIPAFSNGNPSVQVFTPPLANGDGGFSNIVQFFSIPKKTITITGDPKTKKYGEQLPVFTSTILVNNVPLAQSGLTLQDIGLTNLTYATNATPLSNIGSQYFIKPVRTFDTTNASDVGLLEAYNYDTIPGLLTITKLPVTVIPDDITVTYGDPIEITLTYQYDPAIAAANPEVTNILRLSHEVLLTSDAIGLINRQPVALSNGQPIALSNGQPIALSNGQPVALSNGQYVPIANAQSVTGFQTGIATIVPYTLSDAELANLSFFVSNQSLLNARTLSTSTKVVDFAQEAVLGYNSDPALTNLVNIIPQTNARGILGADPLANRQPVALSNGQPIALSNGQPIALSNGQPVALSNGQPVALSNGQPIGVTNSFNQQAGRIAVIIDQIDVLNQQQGIIINSINCITGLTSGEQKIIPGTLLNDNFDITYGLGKLKINPANVTVKANDVTRPYGEPNPVFTATYSDLKYDESLETSDITGSPSLTTTAVQTSPVGVYAITASSGSLTSSNYRFNNFQNGLLTIANNPCLLTHKAATNFGSTANPGRATSLWLNIVTKVSGQLRTQGDYLLFSFGTVSFNNITSSPTVTNTPIPAGKIIADNTVSAPVTSFDEANNTWITKVPLGFSSTSDIFIAGVIINSSNGFVKKNNANSVIKGIFYSNVNFSDQWNYGIAAYQPQFNYSTIAGPGQVTSVNGNYKAGTPTTQLNRLVNGAGGGGGNNYTGSGSSFDNFTACLQTTSTITNSSRPGNNIGMVTNENVEEGVPSVSVTPNPAGIYADISVVPSVRGNLQITVFSIGGIKVFDIYNGFTEAGKVYRKRLDVNRLSAGIYFIRAQNGEKNEIKKLVIAR